MLPESLGMGKGEKTKLEDYCSVKHNKEDKIWFRWWAYNHSIDILSMQESNGTENSPGTEEL